ncbi:MAG TPA: hypothetical protein VJ902_07775, partial [Wenzhouxiangellaceae bacterium]|nr:hypothetical protein [Wenzhouxiangellaceae bacterium]
SQLQTIDGKLMLRGVWRPGFSRKPPPRRMHSRKAAEGGLCAKAPITANQARNYTLFFRDATSGSGL